MSLHHATTKKELFIHRTIGKPFSRKPSVLFISLHKCAGNLFSKTVLPQLKGRNHINFQRLHYQDSGDGHLDVKTRKYGYTYGVIRILDSHHPSSQLTETLLEPVNRNGRKLVFMVRDPRDLIVSMYYSFGFSHPLSPNPRIRVYQEQRRNSIQNMTIDQYALHTAPHLEEKFHRLQVLMDDTPSSNCLFLKYEDMVDNYNDFFQRFHHFAGLNRDLEKELFNVTRPRDDEQITEHKRKGKPGDYKNKLRPETIKQLNGLLAGTLKNFQYSAD